MSTPKELIDRVLQEELRKAEKLVALVWAILKSDASSTNLAQALKGAEAWNEEIEAAIDYNKLDRS